MLGGITISDNVISVSEDDLLEVLDFIVDNVPAIDRPIVKSISFGKSAWVVFDRQIPENWHNAIRDL